MVKPDLRKALREDAAALPRSLEGKGNSYIGKIRQAGGEEISRLESSWSLRELVQSIVDRTQEQSERHFDQSIQPRERRSPFVP
jgi:hypothetical protein